MVFGEFLAASPQHVHHGGRGDDLLVRPNLALEQERHRRAGLALVGVVPETADELADLMFEPTDEDLGLELPLEEEGDTDAGGISRVNDYEPCGIFLA